MEVGFDGGGQTAAGGLGLKPVSRSPAEAGWQEMDDANTPAKAGCKEEPAKARLNSLGRMFEEVLGLKMMALLTGALPSHREMRDRTHE